YLPKISPDSSAIAKSFGSDKFVELPAAAEVRLRAMNIGQLLFELAPQETLAKRYRDLAAMIHLPAIAKAAAKKAEAQGFLAKLKHTLTGV
ncbi:MAG: hypothetical protein ABIR53_03830, partial [Paraperlucidibaca sp.]